MTKNKRTLKTFLCYAHSDIEAVRPLFSRLKSDGVDVWWDIEKLIPGSDWELEIRKAVRESDAVIVFLSKQFQLKGFRQKEIKIALEEADMQPEGAIFIVPARLEECEPLHNLQRLHWVDLFKSDGYEKLLHALRIRAKKIGVTLRSQNNKSTKTKSVQITEPEVPSLVKIENNTLQGSENENSHVRSSGPLNKETKESGTNLLPNKSIDILADIERIPPVALKNTSKRNQAVKDNQKNCS